MIGKYCRESRKSNEKNKKTKKGTTFSFSFRTFGSSSRIAEQKYEKSKGDRDARLWYTYRKASTFNRESSTYTMNYTDYIRICRLET